MANEFEVDVDVRTTQTQAWLRHVFEDQLPFATKEAINATALDFQRVQQEHMATIFDVRQPFFVPRSVKIKPFATKARQWAKVSIDPPGSAPKDILTKFETETKKEPFTGERLAIPIEARLRVRGGVVPSQRPKALEFEEWGQGPKGRVLIGKKRTFMVLRPGGRGEIYQRTGRGKRSDLKLLFSFQPEAPIQPNLHFVRNARRIVGRRFGPNFAKAFEKAIRTARQPRVTPRGSVGRVARAVGGSLPRFTP